MSKKISFINQIIDSFKFDHHRNIRNVISRINKQHELTYDYGANYFYQSLEKINLSGLRNSTKRIRSYNIDDIIKNKEILDIGTNSGFLILSLSKIYKFCTGIDYSKKLIEIADIVKNYLKLKNISFLNDDFMNYNFTKNYDVVFSFANHSTYDGGIKNTQEYLKKCNLLLKNGGYFLIESHHPNYEKIEIFSQIISEFLEKYKYTVIKSDYLYTGNFYDDGRKFYILKKY